ncbi:MAG: penicillin acylase family protein, partial [Candidatus Hydrogenedentes bacterium]|nr:penicillin acylase family protein [Candidatus Hydrogenedentota bacterium]
QPLPDVDTLWADATLYRDEWGVPHVFAGTPQGLGFAFGYAQAEDHLVDMLLAYRMANGRAAAVLGEGYAQADAFALKMHHAQLAQEALPTLDPATQALCTGFAQGVNRFIVEHAAQVPEWVEGVQPSDILALWHAYLMSNAPFDAPPPLAGPPAATTGNAWALAPSRTEAGKTLLVINPHQYFDGPFRWYEAHLRLEDMDVAGATLYGLPVILQGHNHVLGWAMTPNKPDIADLFVERFDKTPRNPNDPRRSAESVNEEQALLLMYMSQAQPYYVRTDAGMDERFVPAYLGTRGPVFENGPELISWRVGGFYDFGGLRQLMEMGRAQDIESFQQALGLQQLPCFNVIYGDRAGNIFYLYNAKAGARAVLESDQEGNLQVQAVDWKSPLPWEWEFPAWRSVVPTDQLPFVLNPPSGYLQACGAPPWLAAEDAGLLPDQWPAWFIGDTDTFRARRVRQLLHQGLRNFRDVQSMLYDTVLPAAVELTPRLLAAAETFPQSTASAHPDLPVALDLLRNWNYVAAPNSPAMTYYQAWWRAVEARAVGQFPNTGTLYDALLQDTQAAQELMMGAAADAARQMRNAFPAISVPWGDVHRIQRGLRDAPLMGAATGEPIFLAAGPAGNSGRTYMNYGYGFAMAIEFGDEPEACSIVPFGASDVAGSPHFDDQLDLFLDRRLKKTRFLEDEVLRYAASARGSIVQLRPLGVQGHVIFKAPDVIQARLLTSVDAPAPLPAGLAAFTLFVRPETAPALMESQLALELEVPEAVCDPANLPALALYAWSESSGWQPLPAQNVDVEKGRIAGRLHGPAPFVVLGPAELLLLPQEDRQPEPILAQEPAPTVPKPASYETAETTPLPADPTPAPTGNKGIFLPLREGERIREGERTREPVPASAQTVPSDSSTTETPGVPAAPGNRKFIFQWLDKVKAGLKPPGPRQEKPAFQPQGPTGRRTFRLERIKETKAEAEEDAPDEPQERTPASLPNVSESAAQPAVTPQEAASGAAVPMDAETHDSTSPNNAPALPDAAAAARDNTSEETAVPEPAAPAAPSPTPGQPTGQRVFKLERASE